MCENVWGCEELRREIFSYLRKEAKIKCFECGEVCVWDKKTRTLYYEYGVNTYFCMSCYWKNLLDLCVVS